jgi:hypothetical protein
MILQIQQRLSYFAYNIITLSHDYDIAVYSPIDRVNNNHVCYQDSFTWLYTFNNDQCMQIMFDSDVKSKHNLLWMKMKLKRIRHVNRLNEQIQESSSSLLTMFSVKSALILLPFLAVAQLESCTSKAISWLLCCLSFFDLRILIVPLVSSNSSSYRI